MREKITLITGANGEIGQELIKKLSKNKTIKLVALDLHPIENNISDLLYEKIIGNILDNNLLEQIGSTYEITEIYHLAALLSTRSEFSPHIISGILYLTAICTGTVKIPICSGH